MPLPAVSLVAVPGRRRQTIDIARDIERRGFSGIYTPSMYGNMSQCEAMCCNPAQPEGVVQKLGYRSIPIDRGERMRD